MDEQDGREDKPAVPDLRAAAHRLAALPDRRMRSARLAELLRAIDPTDAAWLLDSLATAGRAGGPPFDVALLAAVDLAAGDELDYELRRSIFVAAEECGLLAAKELLLTDFDVAEHAGAAPRALVPGTRPLTLGERKALARSWRRDVLERLLADPHADVVKLLLANPHVTEEDILRISTSRRSPSAVLTLVLQAERWGRRPRIRRALVRNPNLPLATALRLVGLLNRAEIRELASDPSLPESLLNSLGRRLRPPAS